MSEEIYALHEGAFGRAVVLELRGHLVAHAHAQAQFAFWLGGARAAAHLGSELVEYSEHLALGTNTYESHDAQLMETSRPAVFLCLYMNKDWLDQQSRETGRAFYFPSPRVPITPRVRQACWRVLDIVVSPHSDARHQVDEEVATLIGAAIDSALSPVDPLQSRLRVRHVDHRLRDAIAFMREHIAEPIGVEDLAGRIGLSRAHFFALFRDQLNTTPQVFWSAVKVEEAIRMLVSREDSLTSVAMDLGFSNPGNFSRFFRGHMGVSPSRFRRVAGTRQARPLTAID